MIVICEECGKKYRVDFSKIKGKAASFNCHVCSHVIMVFKARVTPRQPDSKMKVKSTPSIDDRLSADGPDIKDGTPTAEKAKSGTRHRRKAGGFGLRAKMLLMFFFIPLILTAGVNLFYLWHFETTSRLLVQESSKIITQLAEEKIANKMDESIGPAQLMHTRAKVLTDKARMIALMMLGATLLLIGIIVFIYVHRLTGKIKMLTGVAERISMGELETEIETKSRDEIGQLAEAIARIQDNIRLSIERLRRQHKQNEDGTHIRGLKPE
jgi:predicted Zn finger-like uncharacterized protein